MVGVVFCFSAFGFLIKIKFPDFYVQDHHGEERWTVGFNSIYGYSTGVTIWVIYAPIGVGLILLGFALQNMENTAKRMTQEDLKDGVRQRVRSASTSHRELLASSVL